MRARRFALVAIVGVILAADAVAIRGAGAPGLSSVATPDPVVARRDADAFRVKLGEISRRGGEAATVRPDAARTTVTEPEVNGYLTLDVADDLPAGVVSPNVVMLGQGRASGQAVVDLDRVRQGLGANSVLNPLSYLRGRLPVVATGTLESHDGIGAAAVRVGDGLRRARAEVRAPADRQLLLEIRNVSFRHQPRRPVRAARAHSRDPGRARKSHRRPITCRLESQRLVVWLTTSSRRRCSS